MRMLGLLLILHSCCARGRRVGNDCFHVRLDGKRIHAIAPSARYTAVACSALRCRRLP